MISKLFPRIIYCSSAKAMREEKFKTIVTSSSLFVLLLKAILIFSKSVGLSSTTAPLLRHPFRVEDDFCCVPVHSAGADLQTSIQMGQQFS